MSAASQRPGAAGGAREVTAPLASGRNSAAKRRTDGGAPGERRRQRKKKAGKDEKPGAAESVEEQSPEAGPDEHGHFDYFA